MLLVKNGVMTVAELETAELSYANAVSQLVSAKTSLDNASIALEDVTIRAPSAGTVIQRDVSEGQVIASATGNVSGGTTLLEMANLNEIMDSTLVAESDIGNVRAGLNATVKVDAYPNRTFHGTVEKISPVATVQQSVTMFPVFIRIDNRDGALMPGMNSDVSILVEQRDNVLAVPNDAVRSPRDARAAAKALGLDPVAVMSQLTGGRSDSAGEAAAAAGRRCRRLSATRSRGASPRIPPRSRSWRTLRAADDGRRRPRGARARRCSAVYDSLHIDAASARACAQLRRPSAGGTGLTTADGETPNNGTSKPRPGLVFLAQNGTFVPKILSLGVGNYDVTQVLSGLAEGDKVALDQRGDAAAGAAGHAGAHPEPHGPAGREPAEQTRRRRDRVGRVARAADARGGAAATARRPRPRRRPAPGDSVT